MVTSTGDVFGSMVARPARAARVEKMLDADGMLRVRRPAGS